MGGGTYDTVPILDESDKALLGIVTDKNSKKGVATTGDTITARHLDTVDTSLLERAHNASHTGMKEVS